LKTPKETDILIESQWRVSVFVGVGFELSLHSP